MHHAGCWIFRFLFAEYRRKKLGRGSRDPRRVSTGRYLGRFFMALRFHNSRRANASQRGMSLLEVLIAAFILIVGVLGVMGLVITAIGANSVSRQQSNSTA